MKFCKAATVKCPPLQKYPNIYILQYSAIFYRLLFCVCAWRREEGREVEEGRGGGESILPTVLCLVTCVFAYSSALFVITVHSFTSCFNIRNTASIIVSLLHHIQAVIIWGALPALVAVVVFTILMVYNCLVCYCCCPNEMYNAKKKAIRCGVVTGIGVLVCM